MGREVFPVGNVPGEGGGQGRRRRAGLPGRRNTEETMYQGVACLRSWKSLRMAIGERGEAAERESRSLGKASTCSARVCIFSTWEPHPKPHKGEGYILLGDHHGGFNNNTNVQAPLGAAESGSREVEPWVSAFLVSSPG